MAIAPIYTDEKAARKHLEGLLWPDGPVCPHCGTVDEATELKGKSTRDGVYKCRACEKPFSVTVGTVFERSHVPLHKWVYASHLLTASKKGISSHQLSRMLGVSYKTAWFMSHRIREAFRVVTPGPMGGSGKTVEADETTIGKIETAPKGRNRLTGWGNRNVVLTLVERGGSARSFQITSTSVAQIAPIVRTNISRESGLMTDEAIHYKMLGKEFDSHGTTTHSKGEYVRNEGLTHSNTVENYYSIFKRGMKGVYQHCAEKHLHRYLAEFDFRYSNRSGLGIEDAERSEIALKGISGKRLTYRGPH